MKRELYRKNSIQVVSPKKDSFSSNIYEEEFTLEKPFF
jgi:hypothetical protein